MKLTDLASKIVSIVVVAFLLTASTLVPVVSAASGPNYKGQDGFAIKANDNGLDSNIATGGHSNSLPEVKGRMTGGGSVFNGSMRVTHGFELNCDPIETPNNLEINWDKGSKFHLENLTTASCTDDPTIEPNPPDAGFDTYEGSGTGYYNGAPGAQAHWIFTDAGEPGRNDYAAIHIRDDKGNPVLSVSGNLKGGNHQAHKGSVTPVRLVSIAVTPVNPTVALGQNQQFNAQGTYSDGSSKDITATSIWSSSNTSAATISASGLAASVAYGTTQITATSEGVTSPSQTLTVTAAKLASIKVTPENPTIALGQSQQFNATGTYTDGSTMDITSTVTWSSSNTSVAIIDSSGSAASKATGSTNITATSNGIASPAQTLTVTSAKLVSIAVTPENPTIALGESQQFNANGTYSDGSTKDITSIATWSSNNTSVAAIDASGLAASVEEGITEITAASDGITSPAQILTVTSAKLISIAVTPVNPTISLGQTMVWSKDMRITNTLEPSEFPTIAIDSDENFYLTWVEGPGSGSGWFDDIYYTKLDRDGNVIAPNTRLSFSGLQEDSSIAVDSNNNLHIAWHNGNGPASGEEMFHRVINSSGSIGSGTQMTSTPSRMNTDIPLLAIDSNNSLH